MDAKIVKVLKHLNSEKGFAFMMSQKIPDSRDVNVPFLLDSGASDHIINDDHIFSEYIGLKSTVQIAVAQCGEHIYVTKRGIVGLYSDNQHQITLEDDFFCTNVPQNLLSIRKMQDAGMTIEISTKRVKVSKDGQIIIEGNCIGNVQWLSIVA